MKKNRFGLTMNSLIVGIIKSVAVTIGVGYLFFNSLIGILLALPFGIVIFYQDIKDRKRQYLRMVKDEFKELIIAVSGALGAGYSLEKAFILASYDVKQIYPNGYKLETEMKRLKRNLEMKKTIEEIFTDFAQRSEIEEIQNFAKVLVILKKNGGNTIKIIRETSENLSTKIEVEKEIETMVAAKRLEHKIMCVMPIIIISYMRITNEIYMNNLYHNIGGIIIASAAVIVICGAYILGNKIVDISI